MLVELCVQNYTNTWWPCKWCRWIFQVSINVLNSQEVIWILFNSLKCDQLTRIKNAHLYEREIHHAWTSIETISKDIQIGSKKINIIIKTQFPIQLATTHTIHSTQGLTLDCLGSDPINVYKHGLTYITLSHVKKKEIYCLRL
jgi:hypothetical protein